jgi:hypothetical protein
MSNSLRHASILIGLSAAAFLSGCNAGSSDDQPATTTQREESAPVEKKEYLFGPNGTLSNIFGGDGGSSSGIGRPTGPGVNGIGVNAFLWRASLDTVSFMPLASADPFGGVIITDWFNPPETPAERFKINLYILDKTLRADGVHATVFRQTQSGDGRWVDAAVDPKIGADFENTILVRARQLKIASAPQQQ